MKYGALLSTFAVVLTASSCSNPATEIVVVANTDFVVPGELDQVKLEVRGPNDVMWREFEQSVASNSDFPRTLGISPTGEDLGPIQIVLRGFSGGTEVVSQTTVVTMIKDTSLALPMFLSKDCAGVSCSEGETCRAGTCEDEIISSSTLREFDPNNIAGRDAGVDGAIDGAIDALADMDTDTPTDTPPSGCSGDSECTSDIACVVGVCTAGECVFSPDNDLCDSGEVCLEGIGCQSDECDPVPCQRGEKVNNECVYTPICEATQECCNNTCVAMGCDDNNPCTDDACGATGCENAANTGSCDDSDFCNGADTCAAGQCSEHAGDPCPGNSQCGGDMCTGCQATADCPDPMNSAWSNCDFSGTCSESGTRTRSVTTFTCSSSGSCDPSVTMESEACTRSTTGTSCGSPVQGSFSACSGFSSTCDTGGTQSRPVTLRECQNGSCSDVAGTPEVRSCMRNTDDTMCEADVLGSWSDCDYNSTCDQSANRARTRTLRRCASGACASQSAANITESCTRSTNGNMCDATTNGSYNACSYANQCINTGSRTRTVTTNTCASSSCTPMNSTQTDTAGCNRNTNSNSCGTTTYTPYTTCSYASPCANTGSRTRVRTTFACSSGGCVSTDTTETDTAGCTRSTTGNTCPGPGCGPWSTCGNNFECQGTQTRTCTTSTCNSSGTCVGTTSTQNQPCTSPNGTSCGGGSGCICQNGGCIFSGGGPPQICAL